ncbi:hypothetical protein HDA40_003685 [Hamadaea flava]|uniref:DUF2637 domain-containing protein n=1 Tax=Hamadaea flava TaxID=1742688 RepID=A0ABV8LK39_9ACTN|nr:hypothetical protein [Hamadaea flava]MCP2325178.1 hypothetical protein [Hamadaea flava]
MSFDDLTTYYQANETVVTGLALLTLVGLMLLTANRMRKMSAHRATLLVANLLTVVAAGLATAVSASGMWKFFTDILGDSPLRYAFFWFIEVALFASALLARARLLRDPANASTGVDGIAVWVFAALTASLSATDADSVREVCLRLAAPLVAAWMWERALAAERNARTGTTNRRIHWTLTVERVFVWLHLAEAQGRDVTEVDRIRRRARLGRARLNLYLLQNKKNTSAWRLRRAHTKVVRRAMQAAEHTGLAAIPDAATEREAIQMYMATIYGIVDATSPQAVAHLNAWHTSPAPAVADDVDLSRDNAPAPAAVLAIPATMLPARVNGHDLPTSDAIGFELAADDPEAAQLAAERDRVPADATLQGRDDDPEAQADDDTTDDDEDEDDDETILADDANTSAVAAMRRFWDAEVSQGRVPTGAKLSRAASVPPATGLGRRMRRRWIKELPEQARRPLAQAGDHR